MERAVCVLYRRGWSLFSRQLIALAALDHSTFPALSPPQLVGPTLVKLAGIHKFRELTGRYYTHTHTHTTHTSRHEIVKTIGGGTTERTRHLYEKELDVMDSATCVLSLTLTTKQVDIVYSQRVAFQLVQSISSGPFFRSSDT